MSMGVGVGRNRCVVMDRAEGVGKVEEEKGLVFELRTPRWFELPPWDVKLLIGAACWHLLAPPFCSASMCEDCIILTSACRSVGDTTLL